MAEARKKYDVKFTSADREKVAALYREIISKQKELLEIARAAIVGAHPTLKERFTSSGLKGPITVQPDKLFLRWCLESTLENRCLCVDDVMCYACNSEEGYEP